VVGCAEGPEEPEDVRALTDFDEDEISRRRCRGNFLETLIE
jgi:hypothetical protein